MEDGGVGAIEEGRVGAGVTTAAFVGAGVAGVGFVGAGVVTSGFFSPRKKFLMPPKNPDFLVVGVGVVLVVGTGLAYGLFCSIA